MAIAEKFNQKRTIGGLRRVQGKLYRAEGEWGKAKEEFKASIRVLHRLNEGLEEARTRYEYGLMCLEKGNVKRGRKILEGALKAFEGLSARLYEAEVREALLRLEPGRVRFRLASVEAPLGRPLREGEWVDVIWTVDAGIEDFNLLRREGKVALRQERILRLLEEARAQGGAPTVRDLARALGVSAITIKRDLASLRKRGYVIKTRGTKSSK
jgi:tetratricopeptide (TPR) repeat protein